MQSSSWLALVGVLGAAALFTTDARADSMSCNDRIVSTGDSTYEVRTTCGDPDATTRRFETRTIRHMVRVPCGDGRYCWAQAERTVDVAIEEWTYDFGRHRFMQFLTFEDGRLVRIESGSYGHKLSTTGADEPR